MGMKKEGAIQDISTFNTNIDNAGIEMQLGSQVKLAEDPHKGLLGRRSSMNAEAEIP